MRFAKIMCTGFLAVSWGMAGIEGIIEHGARDELDKKIALTFDACGGARTLVDWDLLNFLIENEIPATLFVNSRWIDARMEDFLTLADIPFFEIANHGTRHVPLSVTGHAAYGIKGTKNAGEVVKEIETCGEKIEKLTGKKPRFFRSGTAHYDAASVKIAYKIGYSVAGFSVNGDEGATASAERVKKNILTARGGDIVIAHFNRPDSGTAQGVRLAVPVLLERGFRFVSLSELLAR